MRMGMAGATGPGEPVVHVRREYDLISLFRQDFRSITNKFFEAMALIREARLKGWLAPDFDPTLLQPLLVGTNEGVDPAKFQGALVVLAGMLTQLDTADPNT